MATGAQTWSTTAASNNSADGSVNWSEGQAPSSLNNSARAEMASVAMWIKDNSGSLVTTGTTAAYTVTSMQVSTAVRDGYTIAVKFHAANDAAATLNVDGIGAKNLQLVAGTNVSSGAFASGSIHRFRYDSGSTAWVAFGANLIDASGISSGQIADGSIAYSKIQNETAGTILGNGSTAAAAPSEITVGTGLSLSATSLTAPAFPPTASFKNLSIKVATTTTVNCIADYVTLATSGSSSFITIPCTGTINMASTGVANGIETAFAGNRNWYAVWAIAPTSTSTAGSYFASTSFTTPLLPATYTYKARVGALVTTTATGTVALMGTYQYGRRAQYIVALGSTATVPVPMVNGITGTYSVTAPTWGTVSTTNFIPQTASSIIMLATNNWNNGGAGATAVAPSTSYLGPSSTIPPPFHVTSANITSQILEFIVEGTNVAFTSNAAGGGIAAIGWTDNL